MGLGRTGSNAALLTSSRSINGFPTTEPDLNALHDSQVDQLSDRCVIVDENDKMLGTASKKEVHLSSNGTPESPGGILHRAFSVLLFNSQNELLLQQRSSLKITYPGHYTNTCCSHPRANEAEMNEVDNIGIRVAAQRRMHFELGIPEHQIPITDIRFLTKIHYNSPAGSGWAENELDHILFIKKDVDLHPNDDEVDDVRYTSQQSLEEFIKHADSKGLLITPWFKYIYQMFLSKWWKSLSNNTPDLQEIKDKKIWRAGSIN